VPVISTKSAKSHSQTGAHTHCNASYHHPRTYSIWGRSQNQKPNQSQGETVSESWPEIATGGQQSGRKDGDGGGVRGTRGAAASISQMAFCCSSLVGPPSWAGCPGAPMFSCPKVQMPRKQDHQPRGFSPLPHEIHITLCPCLWRLLLLHLFPWPFGAKVN